MKFGGFGEKNEVKCVEWALSNKVNKPSVLDFGGGHIYQGNVKDLIKGYNNVFVLIPNEDYELSKELLKSANEDRLNSLMRDPIKHILKSLESDECEFSDIKKKKMISDFLFKMLKLPISYFETRNAGEHLQRIQDHTRIQNFVSSSTLNMIFSMITFIIFNCILAYYNLKIFFVFIVGAILYVGWTFFFLKKRAALDYKRFDETSQSQTNLLQIISGVKEIKLNNSQRKNRWKWEFTQISLFKTSKDFCS